MRTHLLRSLVLGLTLAIQPACGPREEATPNGARATAGDTLMAMSAPLQAAPPVRDPIELIRQRYARIQRELSGYRRSEQELMGRSTEGGFVEAFYRENELRLLRSTLFGEMGRATAEFYLWQDTLFFAHSKGEQYDAPLSGRVSETTEERYYFAGGRLIRWLDPERRQIVVTSPEGRATEQEILGALAELRQHIRSAPGPDGQP